MTTHLSDRDRVNVVIEALPANIAQSCRLPVSSSFVEELIDCLPPTTLRYEHCYNTFQLGEPTSYDMNGPLYETYMQMNQAAIDQNLNDSSMTQNQWYFIGLKNQSKR